METKYAITRETNTNRPYFGGLERNLSVRQNYRSPRWVDDPQRGVLFSSRLDAVEKGDTLIDQFGYNEDDLDIEKID